MYKHNDIRAQRPRRSKYFWLPVWIFLAVCAGAGSLVLVVQTMQEQGSAEESSALAIAAMRSPTDALEKAEARLLDKRIDFSIYRDLLRVALSRQEPEVRNAANQSIARVLNSNLAFADDLKKELASMPTQVFVVTSDAGVGRGKDIEQKLKRRETVVVTRETRDPKIKEISKTEVFCYDQDACKQTAQSVFNLLKDEGFEVYGPTQRDAGASLFKNWVEVVLADEKKSEPNKPVERQATHTRKRKALLPQLAQLR